MGWRPHRSGDQRREEKVIEKYFGFIGYESQLEAAYDHHKRGRSTVFTGPSGCGKTSLILASAEIMSMRRAQSLPLFLAYCNPMKQFILLLVEKLHRRKLLTNELNALDWEVLRKRLSREHYQHSMKIILDAIRRYPGLFIGIDNLDDLTPNGRIIILELINAGAVVCGAATKKTTPLTRVLYQLQEIPVPPMNDNVVRKITEAFMNERGQLFDDRQHFIENITWKAAGNVLALDNLLKYFENEPVVRTDDVRKLQQGSGRKEVSIEWMIYAGFAFIVMLRFVSRATMNRQLYIITSVLAALFIILRFVIIRGNRSDSRAAACFLALETSYITAQAA
jgi:energy-coupling factor transporter ATP-binding protein EcfA2